MIYLLVDLKIVLAIHPKGGEILSKSRLISRGRLSKFEVLWGALTRAGALNPGNTVYHGHVQWDPKKHLFHYIAQQKILFDTLDMLDRQYLINDSSEATKTLQTESAWSCATADAKHLVVMATHSAKGPFEWNNNMRHIYLCE